MRSIPTIWRDTPAPYGPLFLVVGRGITALTGNDVVLGIFAYRVLALVGLALIIWTLPRLARRCGVDVGLALWLGVGNPLVLFHLVSGIHNESLMIGLMLAGHRGGAAGGPPDTRSAPARRRGPHRLRLGGEAARAAGARLPRPALGPPARRAGARRGHRRRGAAPPSTSVIYTPLSVGTGVGLGWTTTLAVPTLILSWMSITTDLGLVGGQVGILGGLGDHTTAVLVALPRRRPGHRRCCSAPGCCWLVLPRQARPDHRHGGRAGRGRAARARRAPLVRAVGPDPARRHPLAAALPAGAARGLGRARRGRAAHRAPTSTSAPSSYRWRSSRRW